jgi:hypothetical protein
MLFEHHGYEYGDCADADGISPNSAAISTSESTDRRIGVSRLPHDPIVTFIELRHENLVLAN